MKKLIVLIFIYINLCSLASLESICEDTQALASWVGPYTNQVVGTIIITPTGPVPGYVLGAIQQDSILLDFCEVALLMKRLDGKEKFLQGLEYANTLTGYKYDRSINQMKETWSFLEDTNDFLNDKNNKSIGRAKVMAYRLDSFLRQSQDYYDEVTGTQGDIFITRAEREARMSQLARTSRELARINDNLRCNEKQITDSEDNANYEKDIEPIQKRVSLYENTSANLRKYIEDILEKVSDGINDHKKIYQDFLNASANDFEMDFDIKSRTRKYQKKMKNGESQERNQSISYQAFKVKNDGARLQKFKNDYSSKYEAYARSQLFTGVSAKRTRDEFGATEYRCSYSKIKDYIHKEHGISDEYSEDFSELSPKVRLKCVTGEIMRIETENLLSFYLDEYALALYEFKRALGEKWTLESYYFGAHRYVSSQKNKSNDIIVNQKTFECEKSKNEAQVRHLQAKAMALNTKQRELLLENEILKTSELEKNKIEKERQALEIQRRNELEKELKERRRGNSQYNQGLLNPEKGL